MTEKGSAAGSTADPFFAAYEADGSLMYTNVSGP